MCHLLSEILPGLFPTFLWTNVDISDLLFLKPYLLLSISLFSPSSFTPQFLLPLPLFRGAGQNGPPLLSPREGQYLLRTHAPAERVPESSGGYDLPRVFGLALLGACFAKGSAQWSKPRSRDPAAVARPRLWFWDHVSAWGRIRAGTWPRGHVSARGRTCAGTFPRGDRCAWALICAARSEREKTLGAVLGEQGTVRRSRGRCGDDSCTLRL